MSAKEVKIIYTVRNPDLLEVRSAQDGITFHEREPADQQRWLHKCSYIMGSGVSEKKPAGLQAHIDIRRVQRGPHNIVMAIHQRRGHVKVEFTLTEKGEGS